MMRAGARKKSRVLIFGDSISLGATELWDGEIRRAAGESFVSLVRQGCGDIELHVDGAVRRTTSDGVKQFPELLKEIAPEVVLMLLGGNDIDLDWRRFIVSRGRRIVHRVPIERFESNLREMIGAARESGVVPLVCDVPGLDFPKHAAWLSGKTGMDVSSLVEVAGGPAEVLRRVGEYNRVVERVAEETGTIVVRWAKAVAERLPLAEQFGADGLHPGDAAHGVIAETVIEALGKVGGGLRSRSETAA